MFWQKPWRLLPTEADITGVREAGFIVSSPPQILAAHSGCVSLNRACRGVLLRKQHVCDCTSLLRVNLSWCRNTHLLRCGRPLLAGAALLFAWWTWIQLADPGGRSKEASSWEVLHERRFIGQRFHLTSGHLCVVTGCQKMQLKAALALSLSSIEGDGTDVVSEVVPTQHQASGLQAALMSSPEWLASWWKWPVLSPPPRFSVRSSNWWEKKERL